MTEPTDWIGGQLTSQAVPPDEHPWIEQFGANASYRALRQGIRDYYRRHYPLTAEARASGHLNPGNGSVSRLCHEPRVPLAVLTEMLAPYCFQRPAAWCCSSTSRSAPTSRATAFAPSRFAIARPVTSGRCIAPYFLDATELGDLLPLAASSS